MMRGLVISWILVSMAAAGVADEGYVRAWVDRTEVQAEKPFWLFVEVSGETITPPRFEKTDALIINVNNPQTFRRSTSVSTTSGFKRQHILKYSFYTWALKDGEVTIPPVSATVDGKTLKSDAIVLKVAAADPADIPNPNSIRLWVNRRTVTAGDWFWIYLEATGFDVNMPETLEIDGLYINSRNVQRSVTTGFTRTGVSTHKRGYYARADNPGKIQISPVEMIVSGRPARSNSLELTVVDARTPTATPNSGVPPDAADREVLTEEDLVFIAMDIDSRDVYLGESVLLTWQLWQIIYSRISTGPYRGALNIPPSTAGFYVNELEPLQFETKRGPWKYNVTERRKLLYPTRTGELEIGAWHWEGIALVNRQSITNRERFYRKLDQGPFKIQVKGLPDAPGGFAGAVGEFQVHSRLDSNAVRVGQPVEFAVIVRGQGNADAIGAPLFPDLDWAHVSEPQQNSRFYTDPGEDLPSVAKTFTYTITPLEGGSSEIPAFDYATFSPRVEGYEVETLGPYRMSVQSEATAPAHLRVSDDVAILHRTVDILADDIHPMLEASGLTRNQSHPVATAAALCTPAITYFGLVFMTVRRRRLADDVGNVRSRKAKHKGIRRLEDVFDADEPTDELFRTVAAYIGDKFNVHDSGMTSSDVTDLLESNEVDRGLVETFEKILKSCDRSRYASHSLSIDELRALVQASETAIHAFDDWRKHGGKS